MRNRQRLLNSSFRCKCGKTHSVPVEKIFIEDQALEKIPDYIKDRFSPKNILIIEDVNTHEVTGKNVEKILNEEKIKFDCYVFPEKEGLEPTLENVERVTSKFKNQDLVISIGSGTVNDISKYFSHKMNIPYIAISTAPSMNGYTSSIAAIKVKGLKRTLASNPPIAVFVPMDVICNAPLEMIKAGLGDIMSKPVCNSDWFLSSEIKGEHFCILPFEIIEDLESIYMKDVSRLLERDKTYLSALMEALLYSGISMVIAGSSSPASGGEHLISHFLDMHAPFVNREPALHGIQVALGTLVSTIMYETLMELEFEQLDVDHLISKRETLSEIKSEVDNYWGGIGAVVYEEHRKKYVSDNMQKKNELLSLIKKWPKLRKQLNKFLKTKEKIFNVMKDAQLPLNPNEIGVRKNEFVTAIRMASRIRGRYTILDIAEDLGFMDEGIKKVKEVFNW